MKIEKQINFLNAIKNKQDIHPFVYQLAPLLKIKINQIFNDFDRLQVGMRQTNGQTYGRTYKIKYIENKLKRATGEKKNK